MSAIGGLSSQKLQVFVTFPIYILVAFYWYFLAGQVFYQHFESIVSKDTFKID
jgi:hypothetical protein